MNLKIALIYSSITIIYASLDEKVSHSQGV
jgi:hypothetical protein